MAGGKYKTILSSGQTMAHSIVNSCPPAGSGPPRQSMPMRTKPLCDASRTPARLIEGKEDIPSTGEAIFIPPATTIPSSHSAMNLAALSILTPADSKASLQIWQGQFRIPKTMPASKSPKSVTT